MGQEVLCDWIFDLRLEGGSQGSMSGWGKGSLK